MIKVAGVIPAKGSSSRIPRKNLARLRDLPMVLWAANNLSRILPREHIYIDSDDAEILAMAKHLSFGTIERPADLASNATDGNQLLLWEASQVDAEVYLQHLPPMVFLGKTTLQKCLSAIERGADSAFGVFRRHAYQWQGEKPLYDLHHIPNSFDLPELTLEGMGLYAVTREAVLRDRIRPAGKRVPIELTPIEAVDIDYPADLELANAIANGLAEDSPYIQGVDKLAKELHSKK